jgi:hypothetical protein
MICCAPSSEPQHHPGKETAYLTLTASQCTTKNGASKNNAGYVKGCKRDEN